MSPKSKIVDLLNQARIVKDQKTAFNIPFLRSCLEVLVEGGTAIGEGSWDLHIDQYDEATKRGYLEIIKIMTEIVKQCSSSGGSTFKEEAIHICVKLLLSSNLNLVNVVLEFLFFAKPDVMEYILHIAQSPIHNLLPFINDSLTPELEDYCKKFFFKYSVQAKKKSVKTIQQNMMEVENKTLGAVMSEILNKTVVPDHERIRLFVQLRLMYHFKDRESRLLSLKAKFNSLRILIKFNQIDLKTVETYVMLEELFLILKQQDVALVELQTVVMNLLLELMKAASEGEDYLFNKMIFAGQLHLEYGYIGALTRYWADFLTNPQKLETASDLLLQIPLSFFEFLMILAKKKKGNEGLFCCNVMEPLLSLIKWKSKDFNQVKITYCSAETINMILRNGASKFQKCKGRDIIIRRIDDEISFRKYEKPHKVYRQNGSKPLTPPLDNSSNEEAFYSASSSPRTETTDESDSESGSSEPEVIVDTCPKIKVLLIKQLLEIIRKDSECKLEEKLKTALQLVLQNTNYFGMDLCDLVSELIYEDEVKIELAEAKKEETSVFGISSNTIIFYSGLMGLKPRKKGME